MWTTVIETPLGPMLAASDGDNLTGLWFLGQKHFPVAQNGWTPKPDLPLFGKVAEALKIYFETGTFVDLPLKPVGTTFQQSVWSKLRAIPKGKTRSYGAVAPRPDAARATGAAVGRNPISIFIPCHRVVGASGDLTGYAGGIERKKALLALEAAPEN